MKKNISDLTKYDIFSGLSNDEMESILMRLNSKRISFDKDDPILLTGDPAGKAGIVLSGKVRIVMEDYYGNRSITSQVTDGEMFAEVFACSDIPHMPVSVFAAEGQKYCSSTSESSPNGKIMPQIRCFQICSALCHPRLLCSTKKSISYQNGVPAKSFSLTFP